MSDHDDLILQQIIDISAVWVFAGVSNINSMSFSLFK